MIDCFCEAEGESNPKDLIRVDFSDIGGVKNSDVCRYMFSQKQSGELLIFGSGVLINYINGKLKALFITFQDMEKNHSVAEDTVSLFGKVTIMQFINIAIISLILGLKLQSFEDYKFLGFITVFQGDYSDFSSQWFQEVGATLGSTLALSIYASH